MVSLRMSPFHLNGVDGDAVTNDDHWSIFFVTFWGLNWLSICNHCPPDWPRVGQSIRIIFYKTLVSIILFVVYPVSDMYYLISTWCIIYLNFSVRYLFVFDSLQYTLLFWEIYKGIIVYIFTVQPMWLSLEFYIIFIIHCTIFLVLYTYNYNNSFY